MFLVLLSAVFPSNELHAQTTTSGGFTGVVTDPSNAVVPNAKVVLKDNAKGTTETTRTNEEGVYLFSFLRPGNYELTVTGPGFRTVTRTVDVFLGPAGTLNVRLAVGSASTAIHVTEETPVIRAENGDAASTLNQRQISDLPNPGNDLTYIAQSVPGAIMATEIAGHGEVSILGMPGTLGTIPAQGGLSREVTDICNRTYKWKENAPTGKG